MQVITVVATYSEVRKCEHANTPDYLKATYKENVKTRNTEPSEPRKSSGSFSMLDPERRQWRIVERRKTVERHSNKSDNGSFYEDNGVRTVTRIRTRLRAHVPVFFFASPFPSSR